MTLARHAGAALLAAVAIWVLSVALNSFRDYQIADIAVYVVAIGGLTVLIGLSETDSVQITTAAAIAAPAWRASVMVTPACWCRRRTGPRGGS